MARLLLLADSNFENNYGKFQGRKIIDLETKSCQSRRVVMQELDKMEKVEVRLGRVPPRSEQIRRGAAPMREAAAAGVSGPRAEAGTETEAAEQEARAPRRKPLQKPR